MFWGFTVTVQFRQGFTKICDFSTYILSTNKTTFTYPCGQYLSVRNYYEEFNIILTFIVIGKLNKQKQKKKSCYFKPSKFYPYKCCLINTPWLDLMNSIYIAHIWVILIVFLTISCEPKVKEVFNTQFLLAYSYFLTCSWKVHFVCY